MSFDNNELIIAELLEGFKKQRVDLEKMIDDVEQIKEKIDTLFPDKIEKRFRNIFEEKVKAASSMFNVLLDIRKELIKSMRDEIEIRRRITLESTGGMEDIIDVRDLATQVEKLNKKKLKVVENVKDKGEKNDGGKRGTESSGAR